MISNKKSADHNDAKRLFLFSESSVSFSVPDSVTLEQFSGADINVTCRSPTALHFSDASRDWWRFCLRERRSFLKLMRELVVR